MIEIDELSFSYDGKSKILNNISLSLESGEIVAVLGPNGSGKTTFLYCLSHVIPHLKKGIMEGNIQLNKYDISDMEFEDITKNVGFLMHNPEEQFVSLNVKHELMISFSRLCSDFEKEKMLSEVIDRFDLSEILYNSPRELSMGQKQKVIFASILLRKPEIILLDEPFSFLDYSSQYWVVNFIEELKREGKTIVICTHKFELIKEVADKVVALKEGEITFFDKISDFKKSDYISLYNLDESTIDLQKTSLENKEILLNAKQIFFKYPQQRNFLLQNVDFKLKRNEILAFVGKNGSGKSTLLFIIAGLLKPNKGEVFFKGKDVHKINHRELSSKIGIVFQNPENQLFCDNIEDEIAFGLRNIGLNKEQISKRIDDVKQYFNIDLSKDPYNLSFGWKKILSIALTMAMYPHAILLDEPDLGLDPFFQRKALNFLMDFYKKGMAILLTSHNLEMVDSIAHNILCLKDSNIYSYANCRDELTS